MKKILIVFLFIVFMLSLTACSVVSESNSSSNKASGDVESSNSFSDLSGNAENEYDIRLYYTDDDYTVVKYKAGETVDVSAWQKPQNYVYEGDLLPFVCWLDEWQENVVSENFVMPSHSMAFYAKYDMPQMFSWSYNDATQTYTSKKAGIRPAKNIVGGYYGTLSVTLDIKNESTSGIGVIWNLAYGESDYIYTNDCEYWYFHLNPTNGGVQLAKVKDGDYNALKTIALTVLPQSWQLKWSNWKNFGGVLTTVFSVDFTPTKTILSIDGAQVFAYDGQLLGTVLGSQVGVRTNVAGNCAKNITFNANEFSNRTFVATYVNGLTEKEVEKRLYTADEKVYLPELAENGYEFVGWFSDKDYNTQIINANGLSSDLTLYAKFEKVASYNGYYAYSDGKYKSVDKNATVTIDNLCGKYGKWSTDITISDVTNSRVGLLINAFVPRSEETVLFSNNEICGYYIHHNVKANANFTLTTINNGVYGGKPDGTTGSLKVKSYTEASEGKLGEYYAKNKAFLDGESNTLTFNLAIEVLNTYIKVYLDGETIIEYEEKDGLGLFDDNDKCVGVGFTSATVGTLFAEYKFIKMTAIEEQKETSKNGFTISADGGTYTSTGLKAATTVDGISGRYGKWLADITITDKNNTRLGLYINAYVPSSESLVDYANSSICCYYLHHNAKANSNFTLTTINNGVYSGKPDGTKGTLAVISYKEATEGKLGEYYAKNKAFSSGETDSLTFNLGIEIMPEYIKIYLDGECVYTYTATEGLSLFADNEKCIGVGFNAYSIGTVFSNMSFISYDE